MAWRGSFGTAAKVLIVVDEKGGESFLVLDGELGFQNVGGVFEAYPVALRQSSDLLFRRDVDDHDGVEQVGQVQLDEQRHGNLNDGLGVLLRDGVDLIEELLVDGGMREAFQDLPLLDVSKDEIGELLAVETPVRPEDLFPKIVDDLCQCGSARLHHLPGDEIEVDDRGAQFLQHS